MTLQSTAPVISEPCASCGGPADKYSSGSPECYKCWDVRKLTAPAARWWDEAIQNLRGNANGCPDAYDWQLFEQWGMREEVERAFYTLIAIGQAFGEIVDTPRPWAKERCFDHGKWEDDPSHTCFTVEV